MINDWNVLVTLRTREKRSLRNWETRVMTRHLKQFGDFQWTKFLGVLVGRVQDHDAFFTQLVFWDEDQPGSLETLARVVPIERTFEFSRAIQRAGNVEPGRALNGDILSAVTFIRALFHITWIKRRALG